MIAFAAIAYTKHKISHPHNHARSGHHPHHTTCMCIAYPAPLHTPTQEVRAAAHQADTAARDQQRAELAARAAACKTSAADAAKEVQHAEADMAQLQQHKLELVQQLKQVRSLVACRVVGAVQCFLRDACAARARDRCMVVSLTMYVDRCDHRQFRGRNRSARWWRCRRLCTRIPTTCCRPPSMRHSRRQHGH